jgi:hypothetical protein
MWSTFCLTPPPDTLLVTVVLGGIHCWSLWHWEVYIAGHCGTGIPTPEVVPADPSSNPPPSQPPVSPYPPTCEPFRVIVMPRVIQDEPEETTGTTTRRTTTRRTTTRRTTTRRTTTRRTTRRTTTMGNINDEIMQILRGRGRRSHSRSRGRSRSRSRSGTGTTTTQTFPVANDMPVHFITEEELANLPRDDPCLESKQQYTG